MFRTHVNHERFKKYYKSAATFSLLGKNVAIQTKLSKKKKKDMRK